MLRLSVFIGLLILCAEASSAFLTAKEHGAMVYHQPRGVSCAKCHGGRAEGRTIATYTVKKESKTLFAPPLKGLDAKNLKNGLERHRGGPPYHLSSEEYESLAAFLQAP